VRTISRASASVISGKLEFINGKVRGEIELPEGMKEKFIWNKQEIELSSGTTTL